MSDPQSELKDFQPNYRFLIAIDSDGCAFDTMEIKHKECFIPNIIKFWNLQPVSKYARAASEFVNLYSQWRGVNRFPALIKTFDLLEEWPDVQARHVKIPKALSLRKWIANESKLGNPALKKLVAINDDPVLKMALEWSEAVNISIADVVHGVPPFPFVRESLKKISEQSDIIVCSATPEEALKREWNEHNIAQYVRVIAGQEMGSKREHIQFASDSKYRKSDVLMIGDAPGDLKSAHANEVSFYPINPGEEEKSWQMFAEKYSDLFFTGKYTKEIENDLVTEFNRHLPEIPPWKK
ncbi:MAG: HAD hydrolase-like protein [Candidatus Marinimicrobia bacterium]|nr:HAD hydrolase-like protein [Candidatus Neomarinimicrobiota bacterium]